MKEKVRVFVIDDDPAHAKGLEAMLEGLPGDASHPCSCVGVGAGLEAAGEQFANLDADLALVDLVDFGSSAFVGLRKLKARMPSLEIVVLSEINDAGSILAALRAGASGYLIKPVSTQEILDSVLEVTRGGCPLSSLAARVVVESLQGIDSEATPELDRLTKTERLVLSRVSQGMTNKEVASGLGVSALTIRSHLHAVYEKLSVRTRTEAARLFLEGQGFGGRASHHGAPFENLRLQIH